MAKLILMLATFLVLNHEILSQNLRSFDLLNRPLTETMIDSPLQNVQKYIQSPVQYIQQLESPRQYIQQFESPRYITRQQMIEPYNNIKTPNVPLSPKIPMNIPNTQSTTIITDCSPSVCKNLVNTIQLMIISNLLQNKIGGDESALQFPGPILNDLHAPLLPCGRPNPAVNLRSPNVVAPNLLGPNFVNPNFISPNFLAPQISSRMIPSGTPDVISNNVLPSFSPNGQIDRGLLTNVLQLLGGGVKL